MGTRIRRFNESKSMLDTNNINDILLDLRDLGYNYYIESIIWGNDNFNRISVCIYGRPIKIKNDRIDTIDVIYHNEILEFVERIDDYLKSDGYSHWPETTESIKKVREKSKITQKEFTTLPDSNEYESSISFEWKQE